MGLHFTLHKQSQNSHRNRGFLLPVVIVLSLAITVISLTAFGTIASSGAMLDGQYYNTLAKEASQAGITAALACFKKGTTTWRDDAPLAPNTDCSGAAITGAQNYVSQNDNWTSSFEVKAPVTSGTTTTIISTGTAKLQTNTGQTVKTFTKTTKATGAKSGSVTKVVGDLSTGLAHTCVAAEGRAYCWGLGTSGQVGDGESKTVNIPTAVWDNPIPVIGSPGVCSSRDWFGNCTAYSSPPVAAKPSSPLAGKIVSKVSAGNRHTCAIADDKVYCWGDNTFGELGNRINISSSTPVAVDTDPIDTPAVPGICSSRDWFGNCTAYSTPPIAAHPRSGLAGKKVIDVQAGEDFTCALTDESKVVCWGYNANGQLGVNDRAHRNVPTQVYAASGTPLWNKDVIALGKMSNSDHVCVITQDKLPVCWGRNYAGQVGNDVKPPNENTAGCHGASVPPITTDYDALQPTNIYMGGATTNSTWFGSSTRPASGLQGKTVLALATVGTYTNAIGSDGRIYWWGGYSTGHLTGCNRQNGGRGHRAHRNYYAHSRAVGPVYKDTQACWSWPDFTCHVNTLLTNKPITMFSGSVNTGVFCAQSEDKLYCDGPSYFNYQGQLGDGVTAMGRSWFGGGGAPTDPVAVYTEGWLKGRTVAELEAGGALDWYSEQAAGAYTCTLASGAVGCWGMNTNGQLGTGDYSSRNAPTGIITTGALSKSGGGTDLNNIISY